MYLFKSISKKLVKKQYGRFLFSYFSILINEFAIEMDIKGFLDLDECMIRKRQKFAIKKTAPSERAVWDNRLIIEHTFLQQLL